MKIGRIALDISSLAGTAFRQGSSLHLAFALAGDLTQVRFDATQPGRSHKLWRHTCFEAFFGIPGNPAYWEVNLSPTGGWNVYRFTNYRQGQADEARILDLPWQSHHTTDTYEISCGLDLAGILPSPTPVLELGLAAVLESTSGQLSYWALHHHSSNPDFHHRTSFVISLP